ncbi:MAG: hypothetical protein IT292_08025 [Deltaproteobacteria bacterium]|nr:hypothetical protein [Deltaproteobacteria bacterium]
MVSTVDRSCFRSLGFGILSGVLRQSATAALAILASMTVAGLIAAEQVFPIMAGFNFGITFLVFIATFDAKLNILFVAGISGIAMHFSRQQRTSTFWAILFGLGLRL